MAGQPETSTQKKKRKRSLLSLIGDAVVPGQAAKSLLGGVNEKLKKATAK